MCVKLDVSIPIPLAERSTYEETYEKVCSSRHHRGPSVLGNPPTGHARLGATQRLPRISHIGVGKSLGKYVGERGSGSRATAAGQCLYRLRTAVAGACWRGYLGGCQIHCG